MRTLEHSSGLRSGVVTKADIEAFIRNGCGICDTAKMRRPAFKSAIKDETPPPIGKRWVFDSLSLRTPSIPFKNMYLTRFINILAVGRGKRRTYGHKHLSADEIEVQIQKLVCVRLFVPTMGRFM